jgi:hypothetical protein
VATQLVDSPPEQQTPVVEKPVAPTPEDSASTGCAKCGSPLAPGQDWCLQCGAGAPGSVGDGGWRPLAGVLVATVVLVLGAAGAGYAALSKKDRQTPLVTKTVAQVPAPATTPPAVATTPTVTPTTPTPLPGITAKPPKIPLKAVTPTTPVTTPTTTPQSTTTQPNTTGTGGSKSDEELPQPEALVLDTNAASTYNPYNYSASWFGDPSLAIDGDTTTGWSAQINPATAPNLAEGLLIDLKTARKLAAVKVVTSTPGITVQVYGSVAKTPPASIVDPEWTPLSHQLTLGKRHARLKLRNKKKAFRYVTLWISKAPASLTGTPEAPGKVTIDELELIPTS